jgi:hypothetical protein
MQFRLASPCVNLLAPGTSYHSAMNRACLFSLASLTALLRLCAADFQPKTLALGSPAPDFRLPGVDGRTYALKDFAEAKILVVVFTCDHWSHVRFLYYAPVYAEAFAQAPAAGPRGIGC